MREYLVENDEVLECTLNLGIDRAQRDGTDTGRIGTVFPFTVCAVCSCLLRRAGSILSLEVGRTIPITEPSMKRQLKPRLHKPDAS